MKLKRGREVGEIILDVVSPERTPHLSMTDRTILILFELSITTKEQMMAVSGFSRNQIAGGLQRAKALGADMVRSWSYAKNKPSVYSLGEDGIVYARHLLGGYAEDERRKKPAVAQTHHFLAVNDTLVRILRAGFNLDEYYSGKGVSSWLWNTLVLRKEPGKPEPRKAPCRPDALYVIEGTPILLEMDLGTENRPRLVEKFRRYFDLASLLRVPPVLFVVPSEPRLEVAARAFEEATRTYPDLSAIWGNWSDIAFARMGEEPEFIRNWLGLSGRARNYA